MLGMGLGMVARGARRWITLRLPMVVTLACVMAVQGLTGAAAVSEQVTTTFPGDRSGANWVFQQPEGGLVSIGWTAVSEIWADGTQLAMVRHHVDGRLDTSFGTDGKVLLPVRPQQERTASAVMLDDGRIVTLSSRDAGGFIVHRFRDDGSLDDSFGDDGLATFGFDPDADDGAPRRVEEPGTLYARDLVGLDDGSLFVYGTAHMFGQRLFLMKVAPDGRIDQSFGVDGFVMTEVLGQEGPDFIGTGPLRELPDGSFVGVFSQDFRQHLLRYRPDGSIDREWGDQGIATVPGRSLRLRSVEVHGDDGHLLLSVSLTGDSAVAAAVLRVTPDGGLDTRFADGGQLTIPDLEVAPMLAVGPAGTFVATTLDPNEVRRYDLRGQLLERCSSAASLVFTPLVLDDFRIVVPGSTSSDSGGSFSLEWFGTKRIPSPSGFMDVGGTTHEPGIIAVADAGFVGGFTDGTFRPGESVSRGQLATIVARAFDLPPGSSPFSDVAGTTHEEAISAVATAEIVGGFTDGTFRPGESVSRGQLATIVARAFDLPPGSSPFSDVAGTTHEEAISAVATAEIVGGFTDGTFRPGESVSRGQLATIVARAFELP